MEPLGGRPILIEQAYRSLLEAIADGRLKAGERLAQESLAEMLQVSRQPVSHALALLKQDGFVVEQGKRGVVVAPLDPYYVKALYEVRAALDATAARLAAEQVKGGHPEAKARVAAINDIVQEGRRAVASGDRAGAIRADLAFHQGINALSGNRVILETAERQWAHVRRAMGAVLENREAYLVVWQEHGAILDAIAAGDPAAAERAARSHAERAGQQTFDRLMARQSRTAAE